MNRQLKITLFCFLLTSHILAHVQQPEPTFTHILTGAAARKLYKAPKRALIATNVLSREKIPYITVNEVQKLNTERIDQDIKYGVYMIENIRGGNNTRAYACQDRLFVGTTFGKTFFLVCDGHGKYGDTIAHDAVGRIPLEVANHKSVGNGFTETCKKFQKNYEKNAYAQNSGTTLVAGVIHDTTLTVANVGDSRLVVVRPLKESIAFSTTDHKATQRQNLALSRSLGDVEAHRLYKLTACPDVSKVSLETNDVIVIASDGYWDVVTNEQTYDRVIAGVKAQTDCKLLAKELAELARTRGSKDDISVMVIRYKSE